MDKKAIVRWVLDILLVVALAYIQRIDSTLDGLADSISAQNKRLESLIVLATFRTDPWSGKMMMAYQDGWVDWVKSQDEDIMLEDMPDIRRIQREFASDLVPDSFLDQLMED